jgi:hypothetical protein
MSLTASSVDETDPTPTPTTEPTQTPTAEPTPEPTVTASAEATATVESATATPTSENESPTPTATATAPPAATTLHVADLDGAGQPDNNSWRASVTITVLDDNQSPVDQATVTGLWNGGDLGGGECVTGSNGQCSLTSDKVNSNQYSSLTFTVEAVIYHSLTYQAAGNGDPDGDSDGTTIVVSRPS